eukprot:11415606-Prorocentrum_lima.AAC.1
MEKEWLLAAIAQVQDTNREQRAQAANERRKRAVLQQLVRRLWYTAAPHVDITSWPMEESVSYTHLTLPTICSV